MLSRQTLSDWAKRLARRISRRVTPGRLGKAVEEDIRERSLFEKKLAHLASFAERGPHAIIETDLSGSFEYLNPVALERFPDLLTLRLHHPLMEGLDTLLDEMRRAGQDRTQRYFHHGDRVYEQQVVILPDLDDGRVRIYLVDITELKKLDQLKTDFVNLVSHEIRSPLTAIKATVQMVAQEVLGGLTADQRQALTMSLHNIDRLTRLVNDLLDVSKIEAGKFELHRQNVDLADCLRHAAEGFRPLAQQKGLALRVDIDPPAIPMFVDGDKVVQIAVNLLNNAFKFTEKGSIELRVRDLGETVEAQVTDTGPGIPAEHLPRVFQKYQQFTRPGSAEEQGSGLGLSLCKGLVELHQGEIHVESEWGKGTRFIVRLPRLTPASIFLDRAHRLLEASAVSGKPLALACLILKDANPTSPDIAPERLGALMGRFEALVKVTIREEADTYLSIGNMVWLLLPSLAKTDAWGVVERIRERISSYNFQQAVRQPLELAVKLVCCPDDGYLVEKLVALLESQAGESSPAKAAVL